MTIEEDLNPRKRRISFSSDDSEPIPKNYRCDVQSSSDDDREKIESQYFLYPPDNDCDLGDVPDVIPLDQVSEAPVVVISSLSEKESSFVAEVMNGAYLVDVGTHLSLEDGTYVGTVVSVFGPVKEAFCVVKMKNKEKFSELSENKRLISGTPVHYDLCHHSIIYSPETQCDTTAGTDASYLHDEELPENVRPEFSDDEKERIWIQNNKQQDESASSRSDDYSSSDTERAFQSPPENKIIVPSWLQ